MPGSLRYPDSVLNVFTKRSATNSDHHAFAPATPENRAIEPDLAINRMLRRRWIFVCVKRLRCVDVILMSRKRMS